MPRVRDKESGVDSIDLVLKLKSMASLSCTMLASSSSSKRAYTSTSLPNLNSSFLGRRRIGCFRPTRFIGPSNGSKITCWFKFGKNGVDAEGAGIYGSQSREDFDRDDVEQYFNYMGMLAVEGTYDKMEALLSQNIHPVDILLMMAASEGDLPKIEELLKAGADFTVKDKDGRTAIDRSVNDEIKDFILSFSAQKA